MPLLSRIIFLRYHFDTEARIRKVRVPVLIMHSPDDEIIPYQLGEKIFRAANQPKYFYPLRGDHNGGFLASSPGYEQTLQTFLGLVKDDACKDP